MRKIYLATSWRNPFYDELLQKLMAAGHEVYDFRDPRYAFKWSGLPGGENYKSWTPDQFRRALNEPEAERGFSRDAEALEWCDTCVMLQPCGASAHTEMGFAVGQGKNVVIYLKAGDRFEAELMYKFADKIVINDEELFRYLQIRPV